MNYVSSICVRPAVLLVIGLAMLVAGHALAVDNRSGASRPHSDNQQLHWQDNHGRLHLRDAASGVMVEAIAPAAASGLRRGDAIIAINGQSVSALSTLLTVLRALHGRDAQLSVRDQAGQIRALNLPARDYLRWLPPAPPTPPNSDAAIAPDPPPPPAR